MGDDRQELGRAVDEWVSVDDYGPGQILFELHDVARIERAARTYRRSLIRAALRRHPAADVARAARVSRQAITRYYPRADVGPDAHTPGPTCGPTTTKGRPQ